jgi:putative transcriptional regulator
MEAPYLLTALPQLQDDNFMHTVVLVAAHTPDGAFGVILNKALVDEEDGPALMRAEVKDLEGNTLFEFNEDLFEGGPTNDESIFALHDVPEVGDDDADLGEGLFLSTDPTVFQKLLEKNEYKERRRFFLGSASWTGGQLDSELRSGSWMPVALDKRFLFEAVPDDKSQWRDELWMKVLRHGGTDPFTLMGQGPQDAGSN